MSDGFVWLDIETTGLDPATDEILELAFLLVNASDQVLLSYQTLLSPLREAGWPEVVTNMHEESGLLKDLRQPNVARTREEADAHCAEVLAFTKENWDLETLYLCGSSIHFDRSFLKVHLPAVEKHFHYRMIDVTSFKLAFPTFDWPVDIEPKHRAFADAHSSFNCYRAFKKEVRFND